VVKPRALGDHCIVASAEPPLICAGDYFDTAAAESTVGSCMQSARAAVDILIAALRPVIGDRVPSLTAKIGSFCVPLPRPLPQQRVSPQLRESQAFPELPVPVGESVGQRVLVVGAGLTGSMVVHDLQKSHPSLSVRRAYSPNPDPNPRDTTLTLTLPLTLTLTLV
jgi:hypothetical protein